MGRQGRKTQYAVEINGELFPNGESLRSRCRSIIDKYLWDGCPQDVSLDGCDSSFFIELVRLRNQGRIEANGYVKDVVRTTREGQVGRHLCFVYGNGTRDMIGWSKLCAGERKTQQKVNDALRQAVAKQMSRVYAKTFDASTVSVCKLTGAISVTAGSRIVICPKSGHRLSVTGEFADEVGVVHHDGESFAEIRDAWMEQHGYTFDSLPLLDRQEGGTTIAPGDIRDSWEAFHALHASLIVVSKKWHDTHHSEQRTKVKEVRDVIASTIADC
jgi:hypothetical protein